MFTSYILMTEPLRLHSQAMPKRPESKFPPLCDPDLFNLKKSQISFFSFVFFECDLSLTSVKAEFSVNLKHIAICHNCRQERRLTKPNTEDSIGGAVRWGGGREGLDLWNI